MSLNKKIGLLLLMVAVFVLIVLLYGGKGQNRTENGTIFSSDWENKYESTSKKPNGLYLFYALLNEYLKDKLSVQSIKHWSQARKVIRSNKKSTFVFIGEEFGLKNNELDLLLIAVENGNDLFIAFRNWTNNISQKLFYHYSTTFDYTLNCRINTQTNVYRYNYVFQNDTIAHDWKVFTNCAPKDTVFQILSKNADFANFVKIKRGLGNIFLNSNPECFFNFQLKSKAGFNYSNFVQKQLDPLRPVYIIEFGRLSENYDSEQSLNDSNRRMNKDNSYFQEMIKSKSLLWATLFSLLGIFLYVISRSPRLRPIIPYIEKKEQTNAAFIEIIASLYRSRQSPYNLLQVQRKNFIETIQRHYFIDLNQTQIEKNLEILSYKSNIALNQIQLLWNHLTTELTAKVDDQYLAYVLKLQQDFYNQSGVLSDKTSSRLKNQTLRIKRKLMFSSVFILLGFGLMFYGLYLLVIAKSIGALLWPIAMFPLVFGILGITRNFMVFDDEKLSYSPILGSQKHFLWKDFKGMTVKGHILKLEFNNDNKISINFREMSGIDRDQCLKFLNNKQETIR